jgi:penicillin-binding protein A
VNAPITRLYFFILLLFGVLIYFTSKSAIFDAEALKERKENRRPLIEEQQIPRGSISTADGVLIAEAVPQGTGPEPVYIRRYPADDPATFGNPLGYSYVEVGRTGIELSENNLLAGEKNEFASIVEQLKNDPPVGADLTLTLDAEAQRLAVQLLQQANDTTPGSTGGGSIVAIEPDTGAVKVMASTPGFDPNDVQNTNTFSDLSTNPAAPLVNRPTQSLYPPGSTFKVVTAAAALDSGTLSPDDKLSGKTGITIGGVVLENAGGESLGDINMEVALTDSINTWFGQAAEQVGAETMFEYMERFGFDKDPELNYPDNQMAPSGVYEVGELLEASDPMNIGFVGIGQERLLTTPLQMAQVAGVIANDGELMKPTLLQEAKDEDGRTIQELDPDVQNGVVSEETAAELTQMMTSVTEEGTAAGLTVGGLPFAGKTGTAEINVEEGTNRPWFIGFAPADDPEIAIAAMIEQCIGCFGGEVAGPMATQVMENLLAG